MSTHHGGSHGTSHGSGDGHYFMHGGHRYSYEDFYTPHYTLAPPTETTVTVVQAAPAFPIDTGMVIGIVGVGVIGIGLLYLATRK